MSTRLTPADLAKFVHPVPVGAVIPAATRHAVRAGDGLTVMSMAFDHEQTPGAVDRWTAEPTLTPEHARLEAEYAKACEKAAAAERERNAAISAAQRLYSQLRAEGRR